MNRMKAAIASYQEPMLAPAEQGRVTSGIPIGVGKRRRCLELQMLSEQGKLLFSLAIGAGVLSIATTVFHRNLRTHRFANSKVRGHAWNVEVGAGTDDHDPKTRGLVFPQLRHDFGAQVIGSPLFPKTRGVGVNLFAPLPLEANAHQRFLRAIIRTNATGVQGEV